jgi:hypothetical protein
MDGYGLSRMALRSHALCDILGALTPQTALHLLLRSHAALIDAVFVCDVNSVSGVVLRAIVVSVHICILRPQKQSLVGHLTTIQSVILSGCSVFRLVAMR